MARRSKDVFGFDELEKSFEKVIKKYPNEADAVLMTMGRAATRRVKQLAPVYSGPPKEGVKPGQLRKSWRLRKVKLYKNGTVRVVRIASAAPHAHLIEDGHYIYRGSGRGRTGRRSQQRIALASTGNKTRAFEILKKGMDETRTRFTKETQKMFDKLTKELEI